MQLGNTSLDNQSPLPPVTDREPVSIEFVPGENLTETDLRLQHAQRLESISSLTAGVAHDFNNLLTAILGNLGLALSKIPPGTAIERHLKEIETASSLAANLTRQLLTYSRCQSTERKPVSLNRTIYSVTGLLERIVGKKLKISLGFYDKTAYVHANSAQIEQVIINLCVNARDAMPGGTGEISIETSLVEVNDAYRINYKFIKKGKYAQIKVRDNGSGMDSATQQRIFEPFFTTKEVGKGTGLGLSMVYSIIKEHGGYVTVSSELGKGTTFIILLPIFDK